MVPTLPFSTTHETTVFGDRRDHQLVLHPARSVHQPVRVSMGDLNLDSVIKRNLRKAEREFCCRHVHPN